MESNVQSDDRRSAPGRSALYNYNFRDLPVLPKILVRPQSGDELDTRQRSVGLGHHMSHPLTATHLFLGKPGTDPDDVNNIPLNNADVG